MNSIKHTHGKTSGRSNDSTQGPQTPKPVKIKRSGKQGVSDVTTQEVRGDHESEIGGWSEPPVAGSHNIDEMPLNTISIQKDYEQQVVTRGKPNDGWDDRRRRSWYPS